VISRRKYHRGRLLRERWVFGGYSSDSKRGFMVIVIVMVIVPDRSAATLLPLVQEYSRDGTVIWSDEWRAYGGIGRLPNNYTHQTVNHSRHFTDPQTGVCTNPVEAYWKRVKQTFKRMSGTYADMVDSHLREFLFRERYGAQD
jgi:hypothetical protein